MYSVKAVLILILNVILASFVLNASSVGVASSWTVPEMSIDGSEETTVSTSSLPDVFKVVSAKSDGMYTTPDPSENQFGEAPQKDEPYFDASMASTYTAYLGKTAVMTCTVHAARTPKSVTWIRRRDLHILTVGKYTYASDLRFEALHTEDSNEWILRLRSVQLRDQGTYECQITTKPIKTFSIYLKVVEPSVEILGAPDIFVNRGSMINLTCVVHHAPNPPDEIVWYHGNETISYTSPRGGVSVVEERGETTTSFLLLQSARPSDSGTFSCHPSGMEPTFINMHVLEEGEHPAAMQTNAKIDSSPTKILINLAFILSYRLFFMMSSE